MNSNWRNRPTTADEIPSSIDYIISIDENGTSNLKKVIECKKSGKDVPESEQHFTVSACVFRTKDFPTCADKVMELKNKYWEDALFNYNGKLKRVCLHSREIRGKKDAFHTEKIDYPSFIQDLSQLIADLPITIYSSHINKVEHVHRYIRPISPYDLCMNFVLERIMRNMKDHETCVIVLEARGQSEDKILLKQICDLITNGNRYHAASEFSKIKGVYFNPKWSEPCHCQKSYWPLEIADICSYPIHKFLSYGHRDQAFDIVEKKLKHYPGYYGHGLKIFP